MRLSFDKFLYYGHMAVIRIENGLIYDGSLNPPRRGDVWVAGDRIPLRAENEILAARYAWLDWPEVSLAGADGLPLAPWRSMT